MILHPLNCTLKIELETGLNEIELTHLLDNEGRWKELIEDNVIKVPTPYKNIDNQLYRIYEKTKNLNSITVKARHIFYDLVNTYVIDYSNMNNFLDVRCVKMTGEEALTKILVATDFTAHSDITTINTAYYFRKNIIEAILSDEDNSFVKRWKGELFLNNFKVYMNKKIGLDNKVKISYRKNLIGLEETINLENVCTRLIPVGYDGIMMKVPNMWVDSPLINNYANIKMNEAKFDFIKVKDPEKENDEGYATLEEAQKALKVEAEKMFSIENIDKPLVNYKIDFVDLSKVEEYKDYKILEEVLLGDTVTVKHEKLNINIENRVIILEWDCIAQKSISIELGNFLNSYSKDKADSSVSIDKIQGSFNNNGDLKGSNIDGYINAIKSPIIASKDIAEKLDILAMLLEDKDPKSPNFGAMCLSTKGFMIASERTADGRSWNWKTFGTGKGFSADLIVAGTMVANRIKGGTLSSLDDTFKLDLANNSLTTYDYNGNPAIRLQNNDIQFFDWISNKHNGTLGSVIPNKENNNNKGIAIHNEKDCYITIGYKNNNNVMPYIRFNIVDNIPIKFFQQADFSSISFSNSSCMFNSDKNKLCLGATEGLILGKATKGANDKEYSIKNTLQVEGLTGGYDAYVWGKFGIDSGLNVYGNLNVYGQKNCIISTPSFGELEFSAYELPEVMLGDFGEDTIGADGKIEVIIDPRLRESINLNLPYQVFTTKYSKGNIDYVERKKESFIIYGTPFLIFGYEIKGKRKDFEYARYNEIADTRIIEGGNKFGNKNTKYNY